MLRGNHGASTLGKTLRRAITPRMTSFAGTASFVSDAMRSTMALLRRGRPVVTTPPASPSKAPGIWTPSHGIVFKNTTPSPRLLSTAPMSDIGHDASMNPDWINNSAIDMSRPVAAQEESSSKEESSLKEDTAEEISLEDPTQNELPKTTIAFKMSEEIFKAAKNAELGSAESYWSHTLYRGPAVDGGEAPRVKVHYCRSKHTTERVLQQYFLNKKILGFDIEWKADTTRHSGIKKNVSLIQLACDDRIALFHIALFAGDKREDLIAPTLEKIMEDASITKVGVAIRGDCTRLRNHLGIESRGMFELSHLYKLLKYSSPENFKLINKRLVSLAIQTQDHLHLPLFKGNDVRGSDWSATLGMEQIVYAASDSYAGVHLYDTMELKRLSMDPVPPRPYHVEEEKPIRIAAGLEALNDEEIDPDEQEPEPPKKRTYKKLSRSYLDKASESLELDPDFELSIPITQADTPPPTTRSKSAASTPRTKPNATSFKSTLELNDPVVVTATSAADNYRATHHQNRASPPSLRCYFLWHQNPKLSLEDIAALLREVPLATSTVSNYILDALRFEKLPYEQARLLEVLALLPDDVVKSRYKALAKECGISRWDAGNKE